MAPESGALGAAEIRRVEEAALRAWPALHERWYDGWLVRRAAGYTKRANSANPLDDGRLRAAHKVARCEAYYRVCGQRPIFRLTPLASSDMLDALLAGHGYVILDPTDVLTLDLRAWRAPEGAAGDWRTVTPAEWLAVYGALSGAPAVSQATHAELLARIARPTLGAQVSIGGQPASCGLAVLDGDLLGLFDVVTAREYRRHGLARALVAGLLAWGQARGATQAYLQAVVANQAAQGLYRGLGFREAYRYWYRVPG